MAVLGSRSGDAAGPAVGSPLTMAETSSPQGHPVSPSVGTGWRPSCCWAPGWVARPGRAEPQAHRPLLGMSRERIRAAQSLAGCANPGENHLGAAGHRQRPLLVNNA